MNESDFKKLPESQRKAIQQRLKDQGLYVGTVDGKWGDGTDTALKEEDRRAVNREDAARTGRINELNAETTAKVEGAKAEGIAAEAALTKAKADEEARKIKAREARAKDAESIGGITAQTLAGAPAALTGVWAGREMGKGVNYYMDESQRNKNTTLRGLADDRRAGLTTTKGARTAARLAGAMPSENSVLRVGGRMLPHAGLAGFMLGKGGLMLSQEDPEGPHYPEMVNRGAALGMLGAGTGIAERGLLYGVAPGVPPDAQSLAVIESDQLRRKPGPAAGPSAGSKAALLADAKAAGIKGASKMNKGQIAAALANVTRKIPALAGPGVAASLAYGMSPDGAQAADGSAAPSNTAQALANAGGAGAAAYGAGRMMRAAPGVVGPALNVAGAGMTAYDNASEAMNYRDAQPPEQRSTAAGLMLPHAMPLAMRGAADIQSITSMPGRVSNAIQNMPQLDPSQGSTMYGMEPMQQPSAPQPGAPQMAQANALPMPQNVPPDATQQANIASEFDPAMRGQQQADLGLPPELQSQIQMLSQQGVPPELLATYLNHMAAQQGAL